MALPGSRLGIPSDLWINPQVPATPPRASVVLPIRNAAATLGEAVRSCLVQSESALELLLILNGCTDASPAIARAAARRDPRVRVLESPADEGLVGALNTGWRAALAPIVIRLDADDTCDPERVKIQVDFLDRRPDLAAAAGTVRLRNAQGDGMRRYVDWVNHLTDEAAISRGRFIECPVIHPSAAIRRSTLDALGGYRDTRWAEDHDLWLRLLESGGTIGKSPMAVIDWHDRPDRLTRSDPRYSPTRICEMKAHFLARLPHAASHGIALAGAGPIGKSLAKSLLAGGAQVHGFFDVHPRRIGGRAAGLPVKDSSEIGQAWPHALLLSTVGIPGGRSQVRALATTAGYQEGHNFWCAC